MPRLTMFGLLYGELPTVELANKVLKERVPSTRLTIIKYHGNTNPNTGKLGTYHYWKVKCECESEFVVRQDCMMSLNNNTLSCGCYSKDIISTTATIHGDLTPSSPYRALYKSWSAMKKRAKNRILYGDDCRVYPAWEDYDAFKEWSIMNGWKKHMVLCRNGDVGNYEPDNCRWGSSKENSQEGNGFICSITTPDGKNYMTTNGVADWCREHQHLLPQHIKWGSFHVYMLEMARGERLEPYHGWTCEFISRCNDK